LIGDHLALDLINTQAMNGALLHDFWRTSGDVVRWFRRVGIECGEANDTDDQPMLLKQARDLRDIAREMVTQRKHGKRGDVTGLNQFLTAMQSVPVLTWTEDTPRLTRRVAAPSFTTALGTVAEAIATLLAEGNFELVRQCEHPDCVLWFHDRTKSHRRRWCSMALCGNRHKAAEFRKRNAGNAHA
jgi:predicted RNA-binding Zn ribbon-like protein